MTVDWQRFTDEMVKGTQALIAKRCEPLEQEVAALKARLGEVESKAARYCGIWQRASDCSRGDPATSCGGLFPCIKHGTSDEPGTSSDWQLKAKAMQR